MTKASENKIRVPFHPLTAELAKEWYSKGYLTTAGYLVAIQKLAEAIDSELEIINVSKFCEEWNISKSAFYRAVGELKRKGYTEWEVKECNDVERQIRDRLKVELGGQVEVVTAVGRIDLLTESEVIEVKNISEWKEALGQILAYAAFFPEHSKRIHLFGRSDLTKLALAQTTCSEFGITVTFEEVSE